VREVDIKQTWFVWRDYLPVGEVALLIGKPGIGKARSSWTWRRN
jgi:hypothetical protein